MFLCHLLRKINILFLTSITFSVAAGDKAGALGAGAGVTSRPQQTQVAAGVLTRVVHCRDIGYFISTYFKMIIYILEFDISAASETFPSAFFIDVAVTVMTFSCHHHT